MTSLRPNLVKRIDRLPKPTDVAAAMQPLFEAISNSIHSVQAKFGDTVQTQGRVVVTVSTNRKKENVWATVEDNGVGLDKGALIVTGNTSAMRGKATFAGFAPTKAAQRVLAESLARDLGPKGVHVA